MKDDPKTTPGSFAEDEEILAPAGKGGRKRRGGRRPPPGRVLDDDGRPVVQVSFELHQNVDAAIAAIADAGDVYQRNDTLVHVARLEEDEIGKRARVKAVQGTPRIHSITGAGLTERLARCSRWERYDGRSEDWTRCYPPSRVVAAAIDRRVWRGIPELTAITETPVLRPDGTIVDQPGHDVATGYLYLPAETFDPVKPKPTREDAVAALAALEEVFVDFPYAAPSQRAVPIAAVLTLLGRPAIQGATPGFAFDAPTRGSGKSLQTNAIGMISAGRAAAMASWSPKPDEQEKVLAAIALQGDPAVTFDNVPAGIPFGGPALDRCLTAVDSVMLRVLGKSEVPTLRWTTVVLASGNNLQPGGDTARRLLLARLEPDEERPEERTGFRHPNLLAWVKGQRRRLVPAALTILRAYIVAGRPAVELATWGSFEPWVALVAAAIRWAGGPDVLEARAVSQGVEEPEVAALRGILDGLLRLDPGGLTAKAMVEVLYPLERVHPRFDAPPPKPDGFDAMRDAIELLVAPRPGAAPEPLKVAAKLRTLRGRRVDGRVLESAPGHGGILKWISRQVRA